MAQITITFQEEGQEPTQAFIDEALSARMAQYAADYGYSGKTELFIRISGQSLIRAINEKYPDQTLLAKQAQVSQLLEEIEAHKQSTGLTVTVTGETL